MKILILKNPLEKVRSLVDKRKTTFKIDLIECAENQFSWYNSHIAIDQLFSTCDVNSI